MVTNRWTNNNAECSVINKKLTPSRIDDAQLIIDFVHWSVRLRKQRLRRSFDYRCKWWTAQEIAATVNNQDTIKLSNNQNTLKPHEYDNDAQNKLHWFIERNWCWIPAIHIHCFAVRKHKLLKWMLRTLHGCLSSRTICFGQCCSISSKKKRYFQKLATSFTVF